MNEAKDNSDQRERNFQSLEKSGPKISNDWKSSFIATLHAVFGSYAEIFFMPIVALGAVIFAVTLASPAMAAAGIVAVLAAYAFARFVKMEKQFLESGYYTYNPLLVGLSLGYLFKFSALTMFFVVSAGVATFLVTVFTSNVFLTYLRLPILSVPFVIVSSVSYLGSLHYTKLLISTHSESAILSVDFGLPFWLAGFFKSFGAVLFAPSVVIGLLISLAVLFFSRILFLLALLGYFTGALVRTLMLGSAALAFGDVSNFNFIFIAMAVGGVFLIPSPASYFLAIIAVTISTVFTDAVTSFWSTFGIPVFTLPFNIVCLGMIYVLGLLRHPMIATNIGRTPEETLGNYLANRLRYPGGERTLILPFAGKWTVWQGFDGEWTHKGNWRFACDFVIAGDDGKTHGGDGAKLEDFHCYKKPVLSPVRGRIAQIIDDLPDSEIGKIDETNKWGNVVIIEDPRGFFVELSHFAEKSIRVKKGEWVERGAVLGLCGNSGNSPQPHIHVQVQATDSIGAASLPFSFVSYSDDGEYRANDVPKEKHAVEPLYRDKRLDNITNFILDDEQKYEALVDGRKAGELVLKVAMAIDGTFYFSTPHGKLFFGKHEGTFYSYRIAGDDRWLRLLFLALPRMPLAYRENLAWHDFVPVRLVTRGLRGVLISFVSSMHPKLATLKVTQRFVSETAIESVIESAQLRIRKTALVEFDRQKGFASVKMDDLQLQRMPRAPA